MTHGRKTILLVDDAMTIRKLARAMLGADFDYLEAENGEQAHTVAQKSRPDLIVMDLNMPVRDGIEGLAALKRDPSTSRIPVIILTSETEPHKRERCLDLGCADFLRKPLDRTQLKNAVTRNLSPR